MKEINEINITVNKAVITQVTVEIKEGEVVFGVRGSLITNTGLSISDFYFSSESWYSNDKRIEIPSGLYVIAKKIFEQLTPVIYRKINGIFLELPDKL